MFYEKNKPIFDELYASVKSGEETRKTLEANSDPNYAAKLENELKEIRESEMWRAGTVVRSLRPENQSKE